jgi:hypothetical protein
MNLSSMSGGFLSAQHDASSACQWGNSLQLWRVAVEIFNKQPQTKDKRWPSTLGVGRGANKPFTVKNYVTKKCNGASDSSNGIWI